MVYVVGIFYSFVCSIVLSDSKKVKYSEFRFILNLTVPPLGSIAVGTSNLQSLLYLPGQILINWFVSVFLKYGGFGFERTVTVKLEVVNLLG